MGKIILVILFLCSSGYCDWPPKTLPKILPSLVQDWPPYPKKKFVKLPPLKQEVKSVFSHYEQSCGPNGCQQTPIYKTITEIVEPISFDQAVDILSKGNLSFEDSKRLQKIIDSKYVKEIEEKHKKAIKQEWSMATCGMYCSSHGSKLYNVYEDGTVELAEDQSQIAPQTGYSSGGFRLFGRRR